MNRRKFATSVLSVLSISCLPPVSMAGSSKQSLRYQTGLRMVSDEGLKMTICQREAATKNKDHKQFIATFEVHSQTATLTEKIYHLTDQFGKRHQIYLKPVAKNRLQAEFNWRTHA